MVGLASLLDWERLTFKKVDWLPSLKIFAKISLSDKKMSKNVLQISSLTNNFVRHFLFLRHSINTVSYTHLTLPTIYSV